MNRYLRFAGLDIEIESPEDILHGIVNEVEPFFELHKYDDTLGSLVLTLKVQVSEPPEHFTKILESKGEEVLVDTSLYAHLASKGMRWDIDNGYLVRIDLTSTLFHFYTGTRLVILYQPSREKSILDSVRAIKSFFTLAVERSGGIQLHSAAVQRKGQATLIMGDMWQGKTTLLLELLSEFEVDQLSCDTTVLIRGSDGQVKAHGWPSPFSVSHGTMADHEPLAPWFPNERQGIPYGTLWGEGRKSVLRSQDVVAAFNRHLAPSAEQVSTCLLVHFAPELPTQIKCVFDVALLAKHLRTVYLGSLDPIYHDWHGYLPTGKELIDRNVEIIAQNLMVQCEVFEMWWAPSAVSLMKQVPALAAAHPYLRRITFREYESKQ